jgi:hypothetical protein
LSREIVFYTHLQVHVASRQFRHIRPGPVCLINQLLLHNTQLGKPVGGLISSSSIGRSNSISISQEAEEAMPL